MPSLKSDNPSNNSLNPDPNSGSIPNNGSIPPVPPISSQGSKVDTNRKSDTGKNDAEKKEIDPPEILGGSQDTSQEDGNCKFSSIRCTAAGEARELSACLQDPTSGNLNFWFIASFHSFLVIICFLVFF